MRAKFSADQGEPKHEPRYILKYRFFTVHDATFTFDVQINSSTLVYTLSTNTQRLREVNKITMSSTSN